MLASFHTQKTNNQDVSKDKNRERRNFSLFTFMNNPTNKRKKKAKLFVDACGHPFNR